VKSSVLLVALFCICSSAGSDLYLLPLFLLLLLDRLKVSQVSLVPIFVCCCYLLALRCLSLLGSRLGLGIREWRIGSTFATSTLNITMLQLLD